MLNWLHGPVTCKAQTGKCIVNIVIAAFVSSNAQAEMIDGQKRGRVVAEVTSEIKHHRLQSRTIFK